MFRKLIFFENGCEWVNILFLKLLTETNRNLFTQYWIWLWMCLLCCVHVFSSHQKFNKIPKWSFCLTSCLFRTDALLSILPLQKSINISLQLVEQSSVMYEKPHLSTENHFICEGDGKNGRISSKWMLFTWIVYTTASITFLNRICSRIDRKRYKQINFQHIYMCAMCM